MRRKLLTLGLALAVSVILVGCDPASPGQDADKKSGSTLEPANPNPPAAAEKTEEPASPAASAPAAKDATKAANPDSNGPAQPSTPTVSESSKPTAPKEPALPKGDISLKVGATLPEFVLPDLKGNKTSASAIVTAHKLTFINFWTTT
ncbi:MAG: hypothetical protein ACOY35_00745 [Bacillota bacterium]